MDHGMVVTNLRQFSVFDWLENPTKDTVDKAFVFPGFCDAIYITKKDDVFVVGENSKGYLGTGDKQQCSEPRKIDALSKKDITAISFGFGNHVLALSSSGDVFSWGQNNYGQLGNGVTGDGLFPVQEVTDQQLSTVIQVACGTNHSMALTQDGEVFAWGSYTYGQIGSANTTHQPSPQKVTRSIDGRRAVAIACGDNHSLALLDNGEVYTWGCNDSYQLGLGQNSHQPNPCKIQTMSGIVVRQIVCDRINTLALTDKGEIYSWGENTRGQLGAGNTNTVIQPTKIAPEIRFQEIAACAGISTGLTVEGEVYVWGIYRGVTITSPLLSDLKGLEDVFSSCGTNPFTRGLCFVVPERSVGVDILKSFDDSKTSDVKFVTKGGEIHCHKTILKIRCNYLRLKFETDWDPENKSSVEVSYPYKVYKAFLYYLYSDTIDLAPEECIGLLDLANKYAELDLKRSCEKVMIRGITVDNSALFYATAMKFDAKELEEFSFRYVLLNLTAVSQTDTFLSLDLAVYRVFLKKAAKAGAYKW